MNLDLSKIDNVELDGIDSSDYPDFSDAFISSADYDGLEMTDEELDWVADNHSDFIHEKVINNLF